MKEDPGHNVGYARGREVSGVPLLRFLCPAAGQEHSPYTGWSSGIRLTPWTSSTRWCLQVYARRVRLPHLFDLIVVGRSALSVARWSLPPASSAATPVPASPGCSLRSVLPACVARLICHSFKLHILIIFFY